MPLCDVMVREQGGYLHRAARSGDQMCWPGSSVPMDIPDWSEITGKPTEFPPEPHTHSMAEIPGLTTALDSKLSYVGVGTAVLVAGVVTISLPAVTANTVIFPTASGGLLNIGTLYVASRVVGTSFTIRSTNVLDVRTINWLALEP